MKCESADIFETAGLGAEWNRIHKREPEQGHLAGEKEDCQLNGSKVLGSIIMEITYPRAFFLFLTTCSFHIHQLLRICKALISERKSWGITDLSMEGVVQVIQEETDKKTNKA